MHQQLASLAVDVVVEDMMNDGDDNIICYTLYHVMFCITRI